MLKTYIPKKEELKRAWYIIDAKDKILGRVATKAAVLLRGKHKPFYTPHMECGDGVIIINAAKVRFTGRKLQEKIYRRFSGYPGGLKEVTLDKLLEKKPTTVMKLAVSRMLPPGPLGRRLVKRLKVYADDKHRHSGQKPIILEV